MRRARGKVSLPGCADAVLTRAYMEPAGSRGEGGGSGGRPRSGGDALAPFRPAAGQNGTARFGSHPDQKPMGPASVAVVGLKRAFGLGHGAQTLRSGQGFSGVEPFLSTEAPFRPEEALIPSASPPQSSICTAVEILWKRHRPGPRFWST